MARKTQTYVAVIDYLTRLNSSVNGNPRFRIHFVGGATSDTMPDAAVAYGLENSENIGVPVKVEATPAGKVFNVTPVGDES